MQFYVFDANDHSAYVQQYVTRLIQRAIVYGNQVKRVV